MKTETKHTPGPWHKSSGHGIDNCIYGDGKFIASCNAGERDLEIPSPEREANARLIAAAPELLEACKTALMALRYHDQQAQYDWHDRQIKMLQAAIAKAEGR